MVDLGAQLPKCVVETTDIIILFSSLQNMRQTRILEFIDVKLVIDLFLLE